MSGRSGAATKGKAGPVERPLAGRRVLITRARKQAGNLRQDLERAGARVLEIPTIEIRPPRSFAALDAALEELGSYDWLILTSVNGVEALFERSAKKMQSKAFRRLQIAAIGPATRKAIEERGLKVAVMPKEYVAESVVEALRKPVAGKRVLLVRARVARDVIPRELKKIAERVTVVEAYETVIPATSKKKLAEALENPALRPDVITFTSSSTAVNFVKLLGGAARARRAVAGTGIASIGPVTSLTLSAFGLAPHIEAREYTMRGLLKALVDWSLVQPGNKPE